MPEMIDKDALKNDIDTSLLCDLSACFDANLLYSLCACFKEIVDRQPTIEPEVRHGRWIHSDTLDYKDPNGVIHVHGMCSCCRLIYDFRDMTSRFKFCPNCGARMDGGTENV